MPYMVYGAVLYKFLLYILLCLVYIGGWENRRGHIRMKLLGWNISARHFCHGGGIMEMGKPLMESLPGGDALYLDVPEAAIYCGGCMAEMKVHHDSNFGCPICGRIYDEARAGF